MKHSLKSFLKGLWVSDLDLDSKIEYTLDKYYDKPKIFSGTNWEEIMTYAKSIVERKTHTQALHDYILNNKI